MMKKENLENQFNHMVGGQSSSNADARRRRSQGFVIDYATIDKEVHVYGADGKPVWQEKKDAEGNVVLNSFNEPILEKVQRPEAAESLVTDLAKMETFMNKIDQAPDSYDAIMEFGLEPLKKLDETSRSILTVQQRFDDQVNVMRKAQDELTRSGLTEFIDGAKNALSAAAGAAGKSVGWIGNMLGKLGKKKDEKSEEKQHLEEMIAALPQMMKQMDVLVKSMAGSDAGIQQVIAQAATLGKTRNDCARELALYIGCKNEVLRRYDEIYIPEAQSFYEESNSTEDKMILENIVKRRDQFVNRMLSLTGSKALCDQGTQELHRIITTMEEQRTQIRTLMENSMPQWNSMLNSMGFAASSLKVADLIKDGNDFSDEIFTRSNEMIEKAYDMTQQAQIHGVVDYQMIIDASTKFQQMIEADKEAQKQRILELDRQTDAILAANNGMLEAAMKAQGGAQELESSSNKPASNDNSGAGTARRRPNNGQ